MPSSGACANCGREADDLRKCTGACGGEDMYCGRNCQRADWKLHRKICPCGDGAVAQSLTFTLAAPDPENLDWFIRDYPEYKNGLADVPVRAVRRLDGYGNSGVTLLYSNHLGVDRLVPYAKMQFPSDCEDEEGNSDEEKAREMARWMGEGNAAYENAVTSPVPPELMKLKPGEAAFNTEKYTDAVKALLSNGIVTDSGKTVQIGYYPEQFPICRIHAPQTDNAEENERERRQNEEALASMGFTTMRL